ncbi:hypothetical protein FPV67DRAFT_1776157 [Lyophyllum atratum]|nr:hypothetical protein FPV67DRAFT_1776157 [Lyophyllum atratum]
MANSPNQNSSSHPRGPGGPGNSETPKLAGHSDTNPSSHASYSAPLQLDNPQFNFSNTHYSAAIPAGSGYNPSPYSFDNNFNNHYTYSSGHHQPRYAMPQPPADLRGSLPATPAGRPTPRPLFARQPVDQTQATPNHSIPNRRRLPPPSFNLPSDFGAMSPGDQFRYIPPRSPSALDSNDDTLPEPSDIIASANSQAKRRRKTPETDEEPELPKSKSKGKKRAWEDDEDDEASKPATKKKPAPRASQAKGPKSKPAATPKVKAEPKSKVTKGRVAGSRNFSTEENLYILHCIERRLPIGGAGWQVVAAEYNKWAAKHSYVERDHKSIKGKFDALVRSAKDKPTGVANRDPKTNPLAIALAVEEAIDNKAGTLTLNDPEFAEAVAENSDSNVSEEEIIEITDEDDIDKKKSKPRGTTKDTVMTKAYRVTEPLADAQRRRPRNSAATEALSSLTNIFNPSTLRERDEARMSQSIHLTQLAATQQEVRELRARNDVLNDRLILETRRADRAESQVQLLKTLQQSQSRRRRRRASPESDDHDTSPSPRRSHTRRRSRYQSHSPTHRHRGFSSRDSRRYQEEDPTVTSVQGYEGGPTQHEAMQLSNSRQFGLRVPSQQSQPASPQDSTITFFGQQPPFSPGPSVFPGSLNTLATAAASLPESPGHIARPLHQGEDDQDPTFSSITLTPRRNRDGRFAFDITPNP